jgi:hypothetical protein
VICTTIDNAAAQARIDGRSLAQRDLIVKYAKKAAARKLLSKKDLSKIVAAAQSRYITAWSSIWAIPTLIKDCSETETCVKVNISALIDGFVKSSNSLRQLAYTLAAKLKTKGDRQLSDYVVRHADSLHQKNIAETKKLPKVNSQCE